MICLNDTDVVEGGASVASVVDYQMHGLVGTAFTQLAAGTLSTTLTSVLYTAGSAISVVSIILVNTHSAAVNVTLRLDPLDGGNPRYLIPETISLGIGYSLHTDGARITVRDASGRFLEGYVAHAVDHTDGTDDIQLATTSQKGLLSDTDWDTFNNKAAAGANSDITSMTGLDNGGIPLQAIANTYGVSWDEDADTYARTGSLAGQPCSQSLADALLPIHAAVRRCILSDSGEVQYYLGATDSTKREDGVLASVLDGTDGQVMTQIPKFCYKYSYSGTTHTWEISLTPSAGFSVHPAFIKNGEVVDYRYIGAYEGIGWDQGTTAYVDCGTAAANNWAGGAIDLANDKLGSVSGKAPMMDETRAEFRAIAANRGTGWRQQDYDLVSAIQLLYLVEYADWNSQAMIGEGRTELSGGTWVKDSYIGVTGKSNADGNGTNSVAGNTNDAYMTYRGIENFFGNIRKWVDGININENVPYVSNTDFADDTVTDYTDLGITLSNADGYAVTLEQQSRGFLPALVGGSSSTYLTDYYYQSTGWRVAALGGSAINGPVAGVAYWSLNHSSGYNYATVGSRLSF